METINRVIADLIKKYGGKDTEIVEKLGNSNITPQALGMYKNGKRTPGSDFLILWKRVFGDDIASLVIQYETGVYPKSGDSSNDMEKLLRELKEAYQKNTELKDKYIAKLEQEIEKLKNSRN
jgi:hypothetical protein